MFKPEVRHFVPAVNIVGDDYCFPYLVNLTVNKKIGISNKHVDVLDDDGIPLVQVEGSFWQLKKKRIMYNQLAVPIMTMQRKGISWHQQWVVYGGEACNNESNVLFTVQKSHTFKLKSQLEVFLPSNSTGEICDFRVVGSYFSQSFKVYKREDIIAEVKERSKLGSLGKESFEARIYPGVDYAFITSLLVIFIESNVS